MKEYSELVKALRHYSNVSITAAVGELVSDAAAAIEELLFMVNDLEMKCRMLQLEVYKEG